MDIWIKLEYVTLALVLYYVNCNLSYPCYDMRLYTVLYADQFLELNTEVILQ